MSVCCCALILFVLSAFMPVSIAIAEIDQSSQHKLTLSLIPALRYFPLFEGNRWVYQGDVSWTVQGTNQVKRAQLSFEMKITSTHQVGAAWIAFYNRAISPWLATGAFRRKV